MFKAKRSFPIVPLPVDSGTSDFKITRGMVEAGVVVSVLYSANVTAVGTAVRSRSLPIRRILLIADNGQTIQSWRGRDLVTFSQVFEQAATAAMMVPVSGFAIANYPNLEAHIPLMFEQSRAPKGDATALPTFAYQDLTLRIEWGAVTDLLVGAPTGLITFTVGGAVVTQLDYADLVIKDGAAVARRMPVAINRYLELVQLAVANPAAELDLGTTANIRGMIITAENTASGEPDNTVIASLTLKEDNTLSVFESVPWASLRADNAKHFGVTMPPGVAIIDFAEDGDIFHIYRATQKSKVKLLAATNAVGATIRAALLTIAPPLRV